ncbi:MAG: sugar transferase [Eubacterium sp.]|nr:sugar transferase [Eubacterium sp.]
MITSKGLQKLTIGVISVTIAYFAAAFIRYRQYTEHLFGSMKNSQIYLYLLAGFLLVFAFYPMDRSEGTGRGRLLHMRDAVNINVMMALIYMVFIYLSNFGIGISRWFTIWFFIIDTLLMFFGFEILRGARRQYSLTHKRKAMIFSTSRNLSEVIGNLRYFGEEDIQIVGITLIDGDKKRFYEIEYTEDGRSALADTEMDAETYLRREVVDMGFISLPDLPQEDTLKVVSLLETMGIPGMISLHNFSIGDSDARMVTVGMLNMIECAPRVFTDWERFCKRAMDIVGALVGCVICVVVGIFVVPAIWLEDHGPVIFKQERVGRKGRVFTIYKFRSMYVDAEDKKKDLLDRNEMEGLMFKMKDDPRITKVGRFIRRTSLDEFPQFFNVLKGDMSIVGTRPPTSEEFSHYKNHHKRRVTLRPGITGMWQVSGRSDITDFEEVVRLDLYYIDNWSLWLDIKIILQTLEAVFKGE